MVVFSIIQNIRLKRLIPFFYLSEETLAKIFLKVHSRLQHIKTYLICHKKTYIILYIAKNERDTKNYLNRKVNS